MANSLFDVATSTIDDTPTASGLESLGDAALAPLLTNLIKGVSFNTDDPLRTSKVFRLTVTYGDSATTIVNPYQVKVFRGKTLAELKSNADAWMAANPTYFVSPLFVQVVTNLARRSIKFYGLLIYNVDATEGAANYAGSGAGGGGSSLGPGEWSPVTLTNGDADPIVLGDVCYISADNTARKALANGTDAQAAAVVICMDASIAASASGSFAWGGNVAGLSGGVAGATGYLGTTPGQIAATPDLTPGEFNTILGTWQSSTEFNFSPEVPIAN